MCNTHYLESSKKNNTISAKKNTLFYITRATKYEYHEILRGAILEENIFQILSKSFFQEKFQVNKISTPKGIIGMSNINFGKQCL